MSDSTVVHIDGYSASVSELGYVDPDGKWIPNGAVIHLSNQVESLRQVCRNVYEVWAGSEGIPVPETAAEAYLLSLVEQMRDEAKEGLK